jgi:hypothetical protein
MWINADACKPQENDMSFLSDKVVVAVLNLRTGATFTDLDCYHHRNGRWNKWEEPSRFLRCKVTHWMPIPMPQQEQKKTRKPYQWGATSFLSSFTIGETRAFEGTYQQYRNLAAIACRINEDYGCEYQFRKKGESMTITRTQ